MQFIGAGKATLMTACVPLLAMSYGWAFKDRKVGAAEFAGHKLPPRPYGLRSDHYRRTRG